MDYVRMVGLFTVVGLFATQVAVALVARKAIAQIRRR